MDSDHDPFDAPSRAESTASSQDVRVRINSYKELIAETRSDVGRLHRLWCRNNRREYALNTLNL